MSESLFLPEPTVWQDLATFCSRARTIAPGASVRMVGVGPAAVAALTAVAPVSRELLVVGMRVLPVAKTFDGDITAEVSHWADRLARQSPMLRLSLPVVTAHAGPALAQLPPRSGWASLGAGSWPASPTDSWSGTTLRTVTHPDTGEHVVREVPIAVEHTCAALGFAAGPLADVSLATNGNWTRYGYKHGFVVTRPAGLLKA